MTNDSTTMRAISQDTHGGPEVLQEIRVPRPSPGLSQILVSVRTAGINPTDWKHRSAGAFLNRLPLTLGWDVAGVVEAVGYGVTIFRPGDEVFGMLPYPHGVGSHAEYAVGPARAFTHKPAGIDHVQAGALPLAALTAYQALVDTAGIRPGQRVLVHAAAGGVGHLAVQIAKARGAHVIGTASRPKHDFLRGIGADEVIDYREADFTEATGDIDVVLDPLAGEVAARSLEVLRPGGTLVCLLPLGGEVVERAAQRGVRAVSMLVEADHAGMNAIADLVAKGPSRPTWRWSSPWPRPRRHTLWARPTAPPARSFWSWRVTSSRNRSVRRRTERADLRPTGAVTLVRAGVPPRGPRRGEGSGRGSAAPPPPPAPRGPAAPSPGSACRGRPGTRRRAPW